MAAASGGLNRFYVVLGGVALAGGAVIAFLAFRRPALSFPANVPVTVADTSGFHGYFLGSDSAPLTVTEFADYECPACQQWEVVQFPTIEERLIRTGKVRWRYRDFPLDGVHVHPRLPEHAAACADDQGQFWAMNRRLYQWDNNWPEQRDPSGTIRGFARDLGLDMKKYDACMESAEHAGRIEASKAEGIALGVQSTPTFEIRGRLYPGIGAVHYDMLKALLDSLSGRPGA
ncbi:MAG TPA: thioredoxin domain-containing protein [Gemmatimonadales bacterium]|nr:thioredoxin domain-containing protein [Gemmatimonadales bacterium]